MIVRDEAHHLVPCLESIKAVVDEIVISDTGSRDESRQIARLYGARLFEFEWRDDFSAARNHTLEQCLGDWILYIDADERLRPVDRTYLEGTLDIDETVGYRVLLHPRSGYSAYREIRVFRNDPRIRFSGLMHETIWPSLIRCMNEDGTGIDDCALTLDHVGYDGPQDHKYERDLPLLQKALAENPDHVYCWYHLGRVHLGRAEPELAERAWQRGVEAVRRKADLEPSDSLPFLELIKHWLETNQDARTLLDEALHLFPENPGLIWLKGGLLASEARSREAVAVFESLVERSEAQVLSQSFAYDEQQFTSRTHAMIGTCYYRLAEYEKAHRAFAEAGRLDPANVEYTAKRILCEHLSSKQQ